MIYMWLCQGIGNLRKKKNGFGQGNFTCRCFRVNNNHFLPFAEIGKFQVYFGIFLVY